MKVRVEDHSALVVAVTIAQSDGKKRKKGDLISGHEKSLRFDIATHCGGLKL